MSFYGDVYSQLSFNAQVQPTQENENLAPSSSSMGQFTVSGSAAAQRKARKRRKLAPPLSLNIGNCTTYPVETFSQQQEGLWTPKTPSTTVVEPYTSRLEPYNPLFSPLATSLYATPLNRSYPQSNARLTQTDIHVPGLTSQDSPLDSPHFWLHSQQENNIYVDLPDLPSSADYPREEESAIYENSLQDAAPISVPVPRDVNILTPTQAEHLREALMHLRKAHVTPVRLLQMITASDSEDKQLLSLKTAFYRKETEPSIHRLLSTINSNSRGHSIIERWIQSDGRSVVCDIIHREMEAAKPLLAMTSTVATPDFMDTWSINAIMNPVDQITPLWTSILSAATDPDASVDASEDDKNPRVVARQMISSQAQYIRCNRSCKVQIGISVTAFAMGASRSLLEILQRAGISISYSSVNNVVTALANGSVKKASDVADRAHSLGYDNLNTKDSIHVEQRLDGPSKVKSGTLAIIYDLPNARLEDMKIAPLMDRLRRSSPLTVADLRMTKASAQSYFTQTVVNVVKILFRYTAGFNESVQQNALLQHPHRRCHPKDYKTEFYPLKISTIEEASTQGNLQVHNNIYIHQLGKSPERLSEYAIPCVNDQLTNARIRSTQVTRMEDTNAWERREVFQLGFGLFHLVMNLIWAILHIHRGKASQIGTLSYYFSVLEKVRLGADHPDYYTLLRALTEIVEGLILNAWITECGQESLEAYAKLEPTAQAIFDTAKRVVSKHVSMSVETEDDVLYNTHLFLRDMMYVIELVDATAAGDFGRIEDILPDIACLFRGAGCNNYSLEVTHFLFNLKEVWTPEFSNIMRDTMLVNPSGREGKNEAMDMNCEHQVGGVKAVMTAKGLYSSWDRIGNASACIHLLQRVKRQVVKAMGATYKGSTHKSADRTPMVLRIVAKAQELKLQAELDKRPDDCLPKRVIDILRLGNKRFESSIATFNKKIELIKNGFSPDLEEDEADTLPRPTFHLEDNDTLEHETDVEVQI